MRKIKEKKVLAVASAGGHWIQLLRLRKAFDGCEVVFASTKKGNAVEVEGYEFHTIKNVGRKSAWNFFILFFQLVRLFLRIKPRVIVTTGSAPGLVTLMVGRLFGTRNVWIDSIANVEELSSSGKKAGRLADLYLTQWESLAKPGGPYFKGSIL